ncbi:hypothetical protein B0O99DRAFT_692729 [Bisporella sp. PMI_857]|nr:hypothetical protein B0O99DRAFT_692729 [Bisporella sp. PMI_857]
MDPLCNDDSIPVMELSKMPQQLEETDTEPSQPEGVPSVTTILIQLNVFNALAHNGAILGIPSETLCNKALLSLFDSTGPLSPVSERCPVSLYPTTIQKTVPHHPWIDLFPIPQMRDNFILASNSINEEELGTDIVSIRDSADEKPTLIVWGNPSDPQA